MKYRARPLIVTAERFDGSQASIQRLSLVPAAKEGNAYLVTPTGKEHVVPGDWVVSEFEGGKFSLSEAEFQKRYERVLDEQPH